MTTSFFFLFACLSTTSVPCTLVSIVWTGASTISFTPTAAARWKTTSAAVDQLGQQRLVGDAVDRVAEARAALEVLDVLDRARRQVVEDRHLVAGGQQRLGQVRSDEPGPAGDECTHDIQCPGELEDDVGRSPCGPAVGVDAVAAR